MKLEFQQNDINKTVIDVNENGGVYVDGIGGYDGDNLESDETPKTLQEVIKSLEDDSVWERGSAENSIQQKGTRASSTGLGGVAEGYNTTASSGYSHAEGQNTTASGYCSHAEGYYTTADGAYSHAEGEGSTASAGRSHAEGYNTSVALDCSAGHAEGSSTKVEANNAHAEGYQTRAAGVQSHAEGRNAATLGNGAHAEGYSTNQFSGTSGSTIEDIKTSWESNKFSLAKGQGAHVEGKDNLALGDRAHAEGNNTKAQGDNSHTEGYGTQAVGNNSHAEGSGTQANKNNSHAEGFGCVADGVQSHAEGRKTQALGNGSHAEGYNSSELVGDYNTANGFGAHAEGYNTKAVMDGAHSEGYNTVASGNGTHAEGVNTVAGVGDRPGVSTNTYSGYFSHAEGNGTQASGNSSHAEGKHTLAEGNNSHAEGKSTEAKGDNSHAEGLSTTTNNSGEHAEGKYNKSNTGTIHSVGIGTSASDSGRKNAFEIMDNGKAYLYGVGDYNGTNPGIGNDIQNIINRKIDGVPGVSGKIPKFTFSGDIQSSGILASDISSALDRIPDAVYVEGNELADKNFVNSSISTNTATFRGTSEAGLTEEQFITWANSLPKSNNDYVFWNTIDENNNVVYKRYKYVSSSSSWEFEYDLNNSSFTSYQWGSINSKITSELVGKLNDLPYNSELRSSLNSKIDKVTDAEVGNFATFGEGGVLVDSNLSPTDYYIKSEVDTALGLKQDVINDLDEIRSGAQAGSAAYQLPGDGIPKTDLASTVQNSLDLADSAVQDVTGKADKVSSPTSGNFAGLDSNGNLTDSGKNANSFSTATNLENGSNGINSLQQKGGASATGNYSFAEGYNTTASGGSSHAEGFDTKASGGSSHAEGYNTTASESYSHAEGSSTTASGPYSHAEGYNTTASESYSHAEGSSTKASGIGSHAEGSGSTASGKNSHAEGYNTEASGINSHAGGFASKVSSPRGFVHGRNIEAKSNVEGQFAVGKYNISNNDQILSVGIGVGIEAGQRKNALEIMQNGDAYLYGVGDYVGNNLKTDDDRPSTTLQDTINSKIDKVSNPTPNHFASLQSDGSLSDSNYGPDSYYTKDDVYTKSQVDSFIDNIYQVVSVLPEASEETMYTIYLVPSSQPGSQNIKDEFITLDNGSESSPRYTWEQIGSTNIDLSDYVTNSDLATALSDYTTTTNLNTLLNGKVDKETGKGLSTEDYTTAEKTKLSGIEAGAKDNVVILTCYFREPTEEEQEEYGAILTYDRGDVTSLSQLNNLISNGKLPLIHVFVIQSEEELTDYGYFNYNGGLPTSEVSFITFVAEYNEPINYVIAFSEDEDSGTFVGFMPTPGSSFYIHSTYALQGITGEFQEFRDSEAYSVGNVVLHTSEDGMRGWYKFTSPHTANTPWNSDEVTSYTLLDMVNSKQDTISAGSGISLSGNTISTDNNTILSAILGLNITAANGVTKTLQQWINAISEVTIDVEE